MAQNTPRSTDGGYADPRPDRRRKRNPGDKGAAVLPSAQAGARMESNKNRPPEALRPARGKEIATLKASQRSSIILSVDPVASSMSNLASGLYIPFLSRHDQSSHFSRSPWSTGGGAGTV